MKKALLFVFLLPLVVLGCVSANDSFLLQKLDDEGKSRAITDVGIDEYNQHLVKLQELDQIPRIREYFTVALQFDPTNTQAQQYIGLIDTFKSKKLKANLANATKLRAKAKRTDDDTYTMFVSMQAAARLDPTNKDVQKMLSDTSKDRSALVDSYLAKAKDALKNVNDKTPAPAREKAYSDAFVNANKALDVDPQNGAAQAQVNAAKAELAKSVAVRVTAIKTLTAASKYADARTQLNGLSDLNKKLDNSFDADVRSSSYTLNFSWANTLYTQKDYTNAEARINAAILVSRTDEATALKRRIADQRSKVDTSVSFDQGIQEIDKLIASGDLVAAHTKIQALDRATDDPAKQESLDQRTQVIVGKLKDLYDRGVQAYRDEDFKTSIDLLQTVVGVQVDYEQAGDYLDRAKSKQKLLDQY